MSGLQRHPTLMLVTDRHRCRLPLLAAVRAAVGAGVDLVLLREPDLSDGAFHRLATDLLAVMPAERLIVNGRPLIAHELGTGLHLRDGQSLTDAQVTTDALRGRSIHGTPQNGGVGRPPDYLLAGNVFLTRSHPGRPGRGTDWLREVVRQSGSPVIAIGGITAENVDEVLATGCHGVAVIEAILAQPDPATATRSMRLALDNTAPPNPTP